MGPYGILAVMMLLLIFLGMFLDWVGILVLAVPIFVPIVQSLSFDGLLGLPALPAAEVTLWFGMLFVVNSRCPS